MNRTRLRKIKLKLNSKLIDLKYVDLLSESSVQNLIDISVRKFKKATKSKIIHPLYILNCAYDKAEAKKEKALS